MGALLEQIAKYMSHISVPSPLGSAVSALSLVLIFALLYGLLTLKGGKPRKVGEVSKMSAIWKALRSFGRALLKGFSWIIGTHWHTSRLRIPSVIFFFLFMTGAAVFLPWPWGLLPIIIGILGIVAVFQHWSLDEDEAEESLPLDRKLIIISGDLHAEVKIAVSFLFVLTPIAFSLLQENGYGFRVAPDAGPFTFVIYTLIEAVKADTIVSYYDLWDHSLKFEQVSGVDDPSHYAKWMIIAYRISLNFLTLAAVKRLLDIARRRADGSDLRPVVEMLNEKSESLHTRAVEQLVDFARRGRGNARDLLERILQPSKEDTWNIGPNQRFQTAVALREYADLRGARNALYPAISGFEALASDEWTREKNAQKWAITQDRLGNALFSLGELSGDSQRVEKAVAAYRNALEVCTREALPAEWARTQNDLGDALRYLGDHFGDGPRLEEAAVAYRNALEVRTRENMPAEWATTQNSLAITQRMLGDHYGDSQRLEKAIAAYRSVLEIRTREDRPKEWAATQINLGNCFLSLGEHNGSSQMLEEAVASYQNALHVITREDMPTDWAKAYNNLGNALQSLGEHSGESQRYVDAAVAFRSALEVYRRDDMPVDWASANNNLGNALQSLGEHSGDGGKISEAVVAFRNALEVYTREAMPADWAMTQSNLGNALQSLGQYSGDSLVLEHAAIAFRSALEIYRREDMPAGWASTNNNLGIALQSLGEQSGDSGKFGEAVAAFRNALDVYTRSDSPADWAMTQSNLANALFSIAELSGDARKFEESVTASQRALEVYTLEDMPAAWARTQRNLAHALRRMGDHSGQCQNFEDAIFAYRNALKFYTRENMTDEWMRIQATLSRTLHSLGILKSDVKITIEARDAAKLALELVPDDISLLDLVQKIRESLRSLDIAQQVAAERQSRVHS